MRDDGVITASAYLGTFLSVMGPDFFCQSVAINSLGPTASPGYLQRVGSN